MKKMISYIVCTMICAIFMNLSFVQAQQSAEKDNNVSRKLTDPEMSLKLTKDWKARNTKMTNQVVNWYQSEHGYYGTYSNENKDYRSRYDKQGKYVETMVKKDWNDKVPADVKSSFNKSRFNMQQVTSYWEVTDISKKGYLMELKDKDGNMTNVWADENGNITTSPYLSSPEN